MDRNTIPGLLLMMALLFGYQYYITPSSEEIAAWEAQQEAEAAESNLRKLTELLDDLANEGDGTDLTANATRSALRSARHLGGSTHR